MRPPQFSNEDPVRFGDVQYGLIITNAGSPNAFSAEQTVERELTVMPDSAARIREWVLTSPRFLSKPDRLRWQASGRQPYASPADHAGASSRSELPAGAFSFTPQGKKVTFAGVRHLPTSPGALIRGLTQLFSTHDHQTPPAAFILRQYGFLLATAPLTRGARQAILRAVGSLPGIHMCNALFPAHRPSGDAFCVNGDPAGTEILLDPQSGVALVVCERLDDLTPLYPHMAVGTLVDSDTFSPIPVAAS